MTDNIADMITRIRNAQKSKLMKIILPSSKMKIAILAVLKEEGYITSYAVIPQNNISFLEVFLKYSLEGEPAIREISKVSKSGKRIYSACNKLKGYYNNMGIYILSTPKGVISDRLAHSYNVGGEIVCKVF
jgi:small subunit ribosomal protein S8